MDAGLKGGISETFQWLVGLTRQSRGRALPWQPQPGLRAKSLVQGHMAEKLLGMDPSLCGPRGSQCQGGSGKGREVKPAAHVLDQCVWGRVLADTRKPLGQESERPVGQEPGFPVSQVWV